MYTFPVQIPNPTHITNLNLDFSIDLTREIARPGSSLADASLPCTELGEDC